MPRVILVDTREQKPLRFPGWATKPATLQVGDYSIEGLSHRVAVERKSFSDFIRCIGIDRDRWHRQVLKLKSYPDRLVIVDSWPSVSPYDLTVDQILSESNGKSKVTPGMVRDAISSYMAAGIGVVCVPTRRAAAECMLGWFRSVCERIQHEFRAAEAFTGGALL